MQRLFSPWRSKYIESLSQSGEAKGKCILCAVVQEQNDDEHLIVTRGTHCYVIMNLFPYNSGHLLVVPYRHTASLADLTDEESREVMSLLKRMTVALGSVSGPDGFNIGSNIGRAAGAGIDQHIHFHIVPRWSGDTNFMPVLADTRVVSEDIRETLKKLRKALTPSA